KLLEKDRFSLHDRDRCVPPDVPETENGGAVGDYRNGIRFKRIFISEVPVFYDLPAHFGNTRRIRPGEVGLIPQRYFRSDLKFPVVLCMQGKRFGVDLVTSW